MNVAGKLCQLGRALRVCNRNLHITRFVRNIVDSSDKTSITFLSKVINRRILVEHCDHLGFTLNSGAKILGPTVLFPTHSLCWNISDGQQINEATLSLFIVLEPKPDLLIIGLDDVYDLIYIKQLQNLVKKLNIPTEIVSVYNACSVFNFVNEEGRYVVAALIPQKSPNYNIQLLRNLENEQITDFSTNSEADGAKADEKTDTKADAKADAKVDAKE